MLKTSRLIVVSLFCGLVFQSSLAFMWEEEEKTEAELQKVPPKTETANQIAINLLGRPRGIHGRGPSGLKSTRRGSDVVYIIDDSGSITASEFPKGLEALRWLIGKHPSTDRYGAVKFSSTAQVLFQFVSSSQAKANLMNVPYTAGGTNTQAGLKLARTDLFQNPNSGLRPGSRLTAVVITDGQSNMNKPETIPQADALKALGIQVFVIAIGNHIPGIMELADMASSHTNHMYRVASMGDFVKVVKLIP